MNLCCTRGETFEFDVTVTRGGSPVNLTNATLWCFFKVHLADDDDTESILIKTIGGGITVTNPSGGVLRVRVEPSDTAGKTFFRDTRSLHYQVKMLESDSTRSVVRTGTFTVVAG